MSLNWNLSEGKNPFAPEEQGATACRFHHAESPACEDEAVKNDMEEALEKAMALLNANVKNESRYFLVEWDRENAVLRLAVTNDRKAQDAADVVTCRFMMLHQRLQTEDEPAVDACSDKVNFYAKDYLSTCTGFMDYSLVAMYTDGSRNDVRML